MAKIRPPARRPCASCPYRRDVPSGVWAPEEYAKLELYDEETPFQPTGVFLCHQPGQDAGRARVCAGWAGCHNGDHLLALRLAVAADALAADDVQAVIDYRSPVPLFASGAEAAEHGLAEVERPGPGAIRAQAKIARVRTALITRNQ